MPRASPNPGATTESDSAAALHLPWGGSLLIRGHWHVVATLAAQGSSGVQTCNLR